ncbi:MAG: acyltransferase [Saccharofermentanales bacterium]
MFLNLFRIIKFKMRGYSLGYNITVSKGVKIEAEKVIIGDNVYLGEDVIIKAKDINIDDNCLFFERVNVNVKNKFIMSKRCKISRDVIFRAHDIIIGNELWCNEGVEIGGGGWQKDSAQIFIGDNVHLGKNVSLNVCQEIRIGNQTGIGIETMVFTHSSGHGQSVLQGYSHIEKPVNIGNNVSIYSRSFITPGTIIKDGVVLGALAYARGILEERCLYLGIPAKKVLRIIDLTHDEKYIKIKQLLENELELRFSITSNTECVIYENHMENIKYVIILWKEMDEMFFKCFLKSILNDVIIITINFDGNEHNLNFSSEFNLKNHTLSGETTKLSEKLLDIFRRYGIIFKKKEYESFLLDYKYFRHKGLEL